MKPMPFRYVAPSDLEAALVAMHDHGDEVKALAGGQSLGPLLNLRLASPSVLVDLRRVDELAGEPVIDGEFVRIGAMTTDADVERSGVVATECPLLAEALPFVAHRTIRNRGTVGGSLAHADPAAEVPAVAMAAGAELLVRSVRGSRTIPVQEFFTGYFTTTLAPDELLVDVRFPRGGRNSGSAWAEFAPRNGDFAIVGVAVMLQIDADGAISSANVVCAGVADRPWCATAAASALLGQPPGQDLFAEAAALASRDCTPQDDLMASAGYRKQLVALLTSRALAGAAARLEER